MCVCVHTIRVMRAVCRVLQLPRVHTLCYIAAFGLPLCAEGMRGYFAGVTVAMAQSPPSNAMYFFVYEALKSLGLRITGGEHEPLVFFLAGSASECASSLVFVPLEVTKARLQLGTNPNRATGGIVSATTNYRSFPAAMAAIYRESGFAGLTAGWRANLILDATFSGTQLLLYELTKRAVIRRNKAAMEAGGVGAGQVLAPEDYAPTTGQTLAVGCIAGGLAAAATNPLDVVASRLMCQDASRGFGTGFRSVFASMWKEGAVALWRGALPRVTQIAPLSAISFTVYETVRKYLGSSGILRNAAVGDV